MLTRIWRNLSPPRTGQKTTCPEDCDNLKFRMTLILTLNTYQGRLYCEQYYMLNTEWLAERQFNGEREQLMYNILWRVDIHISPSQISWLLALRHIKEMDSMEIWKRIPFSCYNQQRLNSFILPPGFVLDWVSKNHRTIKSFNHWKWGQLPQGYRPILLRNVPRGKLHCLVWNKQFVVAADWKELVGNGE